MSVTAKSWPLYPILFVPTRTKTDDSVTLRLKNYNFMLSPKIMDSKIFCECNLLYMFILCGKFNKQAIHCQLLTVHLNYIIVRFALRSLLPTINILDNSNFNRMSSVSSRLQNNKQCLTENYCVAYTSTKNTSETKHWTLYLIRASSVGQGVVASIVLRATLG